VARRKRNAVLQSLELFRAVYPNVNIMQVLAFFYVAENEGLSITELGAALGTTIATASRTARALYEEGRPAALPPSLGLIASQYHPDIANARPLHLTESGIALRDRIEAVIRLAAPIVANAAGLAESEAIGVTHL
jgi:DNA-binding MarR family transcriptional regulator